MGDERGRLFKIFADKRGAYSIYTSLTMVINNYLLTESKVLTGKSQTKTLPHLPSDSEVNTARPRFEILPQ